MKKLVLILIIVALYDHGKLAAQIIKGSIESDYNQACKDDITFAPDSKKLYKINGSLFVETNKGKLLLKDTLSDEEDNNMRIYKPLGINEYLKKALVEEIQLTESKYLLIDLRTKNVKYINSQPFISSNCKYLITIAEPADDQYLGLYIYKFNRQGLELIMADSAKQYYYTFSTGKWCNNEFYVIRRKMFTRENEYIVINFD